MLQHVHPLGVRSMYGRLKSPKAPLDPRVECPYDGEHTDIQLDGKEGIERVFHAWLTYARAITALLHLVGRELEDQRGF